ncbi:competence type IV pilus minor pilin ComGG [Bacillus salitolerans]|uniref:Competence type IV pilus minor pilin ComGG n=1 Tax=Bacillus salitolerans TaxID=1437434 RepID=A0ABW4LP31_9BACI
MNDKERGYILPFVLMICTLLFLLLSNQLTLYVTGLKFYKEKEEIMKIERMLQKSLVEMKTIVNDTLSMSAVLFYEEGTVQYEMSEAGENFVTIDLTYTTTENRKRKVELIFDRHKMIFVSWIER